MPHPISTPWFELKSLSYQLIFTLLTHTISSSNSSKMEDQIAKAFLSIMDEAIYILQVEEAVVAAIFHQHNGQSIIDATLIMIVKRLISGYDMTTLMMILCFRRRYRMRRTLFLSIMHNLSETSLYYSERYDATDHIGLTALQKCTVVVRQ
jgi:hypothetical protein